MSKLVETNEKIAEGVTTGYKKIEDGVVSGYKKIEEGAVGGFNKIADKFVDNFLKKEGETVEEAKERLAKDPKESAAIGKKYTSTAASSNNHVPNTNSIVEENVQKTQNAVLEARRMAGLEK